MDTQKLLNVPLQVVDNVQCKVDRGSVHREFLKLEQQFGTKPGTQVYGVPINMPYCDNDQIWQQVVNTDIVKLGDDDAEYSVAVKVFPYLQRVFSIWIFLCCVTKD